MSAHTPGPWRLYETSPHTIYGPDPLNGAYLELKNPADARLIASAPELLAALESTVELADNLGAAYHSEGFEGACKGKYETCPNCRHLDDAKALIARIRAGK